MSPLFFWREKNDYLRKGKNFRFFSSIYCIRFTYMGPVLPLWVQGQIWSKMKTSFSQNRAFLNQFFIQNNKKINRCPCMFSRGPAYMRHDWSQIWNFQNYTLDWQRKGHLLFYHNVGGNCFSQENASFLTCLALASPKTLRLKDLVNFVSISSWWATWNIGPIKLIGRQSTAKSN